MLRVAFLTDAPRVAGSEIWLLETLPHLTAYGIRPILYLPHNPKLRFLVQALNEKGIPTTTYTRLKELVSSTQEAHVRVIQAWFPSTYGLLAHISRPRSVFLHDQLEYHYPLGLKGLYRFVYRMTKARKVALADRIFVGTHWAADYVRRHFGLEAHVIPVGVDPNRFHPPSPEERASLRRKLGLTRFTLLTPARFTPEKNQLAIVLAALHVEADFLLAGEGTWAYPLRWLAQALRASNVRFLGNRNDIPELYRAVDAVLFPTLADNPGLVILEGMASGLPVIASAHPPQKEVLSPSEGILIEPSPRAIAEAVRWLMDNPLEAKRMGKNGRARILKERTSALSAKVLAQELERLALQSS
ncbi:MULTISPECIES: glycosyltransferase family 4 protein [Thermus]|uniref:glycosyltransferase family 4 protein n=1 Tax=Thermus TaxID=270 RepID=UPI001F2DEB8C|nr:MULTISPECIES: glycosyltransferase family 4 protein [Thermus]